MNEAIRPIKGAHDYSPKSVLSWQYMENILKKILKNYCYDEIRFPIIERTSLFTHVIGNETDVISKEMYSFRDKRDHEITLRPEGTIGCMRSCIKNGLFRQLEQRLWYIGPMFRYERPQYGRYRQFNQLGIEVLGLSGPDIDLEIILLIERILKKLKLSKVVQLELNSIGTYKSRITYQKLLFSYFKKYENLLDKDCKRRLYENPLRILDSKDKNIKNLINDSPKLINFIDDDSLFHFEKLCKFLDEIGIAYRINNCLVRGLDYYNKTVFEWKTDYLGSQNTICAGGRYDSLSTYLGIHSIPAIGCAIGLERLVFLIDLLRLQPQIDNMIDIYIIFLQSNLDIEAIKLAEYIRTELPNKKIKTNFLYGSLKKQLSKANKLQARLVLLLGQNEIDNNVVLIKDLKNKTQKALPKHNLIVELKSIFYYI